MWKKVKNKTKYAEQIHIISGKQKNFYKYLPMFVLKTHSTDHNGNERGKETGKKEIMFLENTL